MQFQLRPIFAAATLGIGLILTTSANASLVLSSDGQTVYDSDLNITWLANANLAATNTFGLGINYFPYAQDGFVGSTGAMNWTTANMWIASMNAANYLGVHDWRLPTTINQIVTSCSNYNWSGSDACGYNNPTTSEMSHLFYSELGNKGYYNIAGSLQAGSGLTNTGPFSNLMGSVYWSGDYLGDANPYYAWSFRFDGQALGSGANGAGYQTPYFYKTSGMFVMAVRDGQISTVPVPAAAWLLGSGLIGLVGVARRHKNA